MSTPPSLPPKTPDFSNGSGQISPQLTSQPKPISKVEVSEDIKSLPSDQLIKLMGATDVLKGYLMNLSEAEQNDSAKELDTIIRDIEHFINTLSHLQTSKQDINQKLLRHQGLAKQWEDTEIKMYSALKKFGPENMYSLLSSSVRESKKLTNSISQSFIQDVEEHDESSVQSFIKNYRNERKLYYLRNEKLHRFNEDRIGGLL